MNPDLVPCSDAYNCPETIEETSIQYDGWTVPLYATMVLTPGMTYHLKMGAADASDNGADSGAFVALTDNHPTSITAFPKNEMPLKVYPNPSNGNVSYVLKDSSFGNWQLIDSRGKLIWSAASIPTIGIFDWEQITNDGVYILKGSSQEQVILRRLLISK